MKKDYINFDTVVSNDEEIMQLALNAIANSPTDEETPKAAFDIAIWYVLNEFAAQEKECFTEDDVKQRIDELLVDYVMERLYKKGLVDISMNESGETLYELSEKGQGLKNIN